VDWQDTELIPGYLNEGNLIEGQFVQYFICIGLHELITTDTQLKTRVKSL
jgi:hypothetical protein